MLLSPVLHIKSSPSATSAKRQQRKETLNFVILLDMFDVAQNETTSHNLQTCPTVWVSGTFLADCTVTVWNCAYWHLKIGVSFVTVCDFKYSVKRNSKDERPCWKADGASTGENCPNFHTAKIFNPVRKELPWAECFMHVAGRHVCRSCRVFHACSRASRVQIMLALYLLPNFLSDFDDSRYRSSLQVAVEQECIMRQWHPYLSALINMYLQWSDIVTDFDKIRHRRFFCNAAERSWVLLKCAHW